MTTESIILRPHQGKIVEFLGVVSRVLDLEIESGLDHPLVPPHKALRDALSEGMHMTDEDSHKRISGLQLDIDRLKGVIGTYTHNVVGRAFYRDQLSVLESEQDGYAFVIEGTIRSKITGR